MNAAHSDQATHSDQVTHSDHATDAGEFLRKWLRGNAIFSALSGLTFVLASGPLAAFFGDLPPMLVLAVGGQLVVFAGALVWLASRPEVSAPLAIGVIVADLLWVVGTIIIIYADLFTRGGAALALVLADVVLLLAILQSLGVHRMATERAEAGV